MCACVSVCLSVCSCLCARLKKVMNSTQPLDPLPARPSTASIRIRTIPHNANPTPQEHVDDGMDVIDSFDFVRDEYTAERLRAISGEADLEDVYNLELEVDTAQQSIAHLGELVPNLETLKLTNSRVESFRDLGTRLRNLKILWVTRCGITELDGIVALSGLQELYIAFNDVSDLSPLALHEQYVPSWRFIGPDVRKGKRWCSNLVSLVLCIFGSFLTMFVIFFVDF